MAIESINQNFDSIAKGIEGMNGEVVFIWKLIKFCDDHDDEFVPW